MPKVEITVAFAAVLKKHRATKGMSQELLAEKADIHPTHVGLIERSLRNPSLKVCKAIADALGVPLSRMIIEAERLCRKRG
jgi:transcriptional regulator with XRE-family HTH domain